MDEVARMRHNRRDSRCARLPSKFLDLVLVEAASTPLTGVLREDLAGITAVDDRPLDRAWQAAGHRHVGAKPVHVS